MMAATAGTTGEAAAEKPADAEDPKPVYPIFGAHDGEPPLMIPTRAGNGRIRWIPAPRRPEGA
jgi:hypothetical protein